MRRQSNLVLVAIVVFAVTSLASADIWFSSKGVGQYVYRMTPDGTLLPSIGTGENNVKDLTVIGDEVWFSGNGTWIGRLDREGARLPGNFGSHEQVGDFALVGDQIWITDADTSAWIERWTLGHVELPRFNGGADIGSLAVVGNQIWYSEKGPSQWIYRMSPDGTLLPRIGTGENYVKDLTVIGDEVWFSWNGSRIGRLDFDGTRLPGDFGSHEEVGDFALVGNEIWITSAATSAWIERWTLGHVELPRFNGGADIGGLVVIPEPVAAVPLPGAALLGAIGLSVASWRLRRRTS